MEKVMIRLEALLIIVLCSTCADEKTKLQSMVSKSISVQESAKDPLTCEAAPDSKSSLLESTGIITFENGVSKILSEHCITCHDSGNPSGDFTSYDSVIENLPLILENVASGSMPPGGDGLPENLRQTLISWSEEGSVKEAEAAASFEAPMSMEALQICTDQGKIYNTKTNSCSGILAEGCDDNWLKNAFPETPEAVTDKVSGFEEQGFERLTCGSLGDESVIFLAKPSVEDQEKVRILTIRLDLGCPS
jgi:hypothetical protein